MLTHERNPQRILHHVVVYKRGDDMITPIPRFLVHTQDRFVGEVRDRFLWGAVIDDQAERIGARGGKPFSGCIGHVAHLTRDEQNPLACFGVYPGAVIQRARNGCRRNARLFLQSLRDFGFIRQRFLK